MQWVCLKRGKQEGLKVYHEAKLVIKGTNGHPRSNKLAKAQGNLKVFLAVAANKGFEVMKFNIGKGYIQKSNLKEGIIVELPPEYKNKGMIWALKKVVNNPYNEGRQFHLKVE